MKTKVVLTILGLFGAVLLIGIGVFVAEHIVSVRNHMEQVNQEVLGLAQQLGYTPDTLLRQEMGGRDFGLGFPSDGSCMNQIFFETPMTVEQFTERLKTAAPSAIAGRKEESWFELFQNFDFDVEHADSTKAQAFLKRKRQTAYFWRLPDDDNARITFYDMLNLPVTFAYKGRPITGNVVEIYRNGGRFLLGLGCPIEFVEP